MGSEMCIRDSPVYRWVMTVTPLLTSVPRLTIPCFYTWITTNLPWDWESDLRFDEKVGKYSKCHEN